MALSFPLNLAQFSDQLRVTGLSLHCPTPKQMSRTSGGDLLQARLGNSLWQGECQLGFIQSRNTRGMRALLDLLQDEGASFIFSPRDYPGPAADPDTAILGGAAITLASVAANNRDVTLSGFPAGYVMTGDDLISWTYGANPTRWAFHRIVSTVVASGTGSLVCEVWPRVAPGWTAGVGISIRTPRFKAVMEQVQSGSAARIFHSGMSFNYIQTRR